MTILSVAPFSIQSKLRWSSRIDAHRHHGHIRDAPARGVDARPVWQRILGLSSDRDVLRPVTWRPLGEARVPLSTVRRFTAHQRHCVLHGRMTLVFGECLCHAGKKSRSKTGDTGRGRLRLHMTWLVVGIHLSRCRWCRGRCGVDALFCGLRVFRMCRYALHWEYPVL